MAATPSPSQDRIRCRRRLRKAGIPITVLVAISLSVATCGGGPTPPGVASGGSTTSTTVAGSKAGSTASSYSGAVAYAHCMRAHGVSNWPDPQSDGGFLVQGGSDNPSHSPNFPAANQTCAHFLANGGQPSTGQTGQAALAADLKYSECMRAHGVLNFPDPGPGIRWNLGGNESIDGNTPQFQAAMKVCLELAPPQP